MAITERSGADGTFAAFARQTARGTRVIANNADGVIGRRFPVSNLSIDELVDIEESNLISDIGADNPIDQGQYSAGGSLTTKVFVEDFWHFLRGILNPLEADFTGTALVGITADSGITTTDGTVNSFDAKEAKAKIGDAGTEFLWPCKLQLVGATGGTMAIRGYRRGGRPNQDRFYQSETVDLSQNNATSTKFWQEIIDITFADVAGSPSDLKWIPDGHRTVVRFQATNPQFPGFTALLVKGGVPSVVQDLVPSSMTLNFGQGASDLSMEFIGSRLDEERTIAGGDDRKVKLSDADLEAFPRPANARTYPSWAGAFSFGGDIVKYTGIEMAVNRNLEANPGFDGSRFKRGFSATRNRQILITPTTLFRAPDDPTDEYINWQQRFRNDERSALTFSMLAYDPDGRQYKINARTPNSQIIEAPANPVTGSGPIERRLAFKGLPASGSHSEIEFEIFTKEAYSEHKPT